MQLLTKRAATALLTIALAAPVSAFATTPSPTPTPSPAANRCNDSNALTATGADPTIVAASKCCIDVNQARGIIYKSQDSCGKTPLSLAFFLICKGEMISGQKVGADMLFPDKVCPTLFAKKQISIPKTGALAAGIIALLAGSAVWLRRRQEIN